MNSNFTYPELNTIKFQRISLSHSDAIVVWQLRWAGDKQHTIAAKLGTNSGRVADVLNEKTHAGSQAMAHQLRSG